MTNTDTTAHHASLTHAALTQYTELVASDCQDTVAWQLVGLQLQDLLRGIEGSAHEVVRSRAVDALATARRLLAG